VVRFCLERSGLGSNRRIGGPRRRHLEPLPTALGSGKSNALTTRRR
jgi:hypothetical protein